MFKIPRSRLLIVLFLITRAVFAQPPQLSKHQNECYKIFLEAHSSLISEKDTVNFNRIYDKIDSLTMLENDHEFYVKYRALRGAVLSSNGYVDAGLRYNLDAVEYGKVNLPKESKYLAVAHGNLGYTYMQMGEIDSFITHTMFSNEILLTNPAKNAADLIQTNFNLLSHLENKPDLILKLQEQNDSLVTYLSDFDYGIRASYHLRKSKKAIANNNFRESKYHIGRAIHYFNEAKQPRLNLRRHFYSAVAVHFYILKNYKKAIENYKVYYNLIQDKQISHVSSYIHGQISKCYMGLNQGDSAIYYATIAYEEVKRDIVDEKKFYIPFHAIELLKLTDKFKGTYDMQVYHELDSMSDELRRIPIHYLEYAKIKSRIIPQEKEYYKTVLLENIQKSDNNVFKSYYTEKLAEYYLEAGDLNVADSLFDKALYLNQVLPNKTNSLFYNPNLIKAFVDNKYKILHQSKAKYTDLETIERYNVIVKNLLTYVYENWDGEDKDQILERIQQISNEAIAFCYLGNVSKADKEDVPYIEYALHFSDQAKSILFKYNQRRILALKNAKFSKDKLSRLQFYKSKLDAYFYGKVGEIKEKEILAIQSQYNELLIEAQTSKSAFVETETFDDFTGHLGEIESKYDGIYVFHTIDNRVYKMNVITKTMSQIHLTKSQIVEKQQMLFDAMVNHKPDVYEQTAYTLYQSFFGDDLTSSSKNILIINTPDLLPVPFEALVQSVTSSPFNKQDYLLNKYTFTYNEGLSSDYDFEKNFDLSVPYVGVYSKSGNNLRYATSEVEGVSRLLKGETYDVDKHNRNDIFERLKLAQVIHIASHSVIDSSNAYTSQLVFGDSTNSNMKYYEIMNLEINPNLLVLNACSTGNGEYKIGEGKISMARAFNYAGAHNVLVNAWDVSDFSVKEVMESFFGFYKNKNDAAKALQLAKQDYLTNSDDLTGNPLYWAGTIFVSSSHISNRQYTWSLILAILAFSGVLIGIAMLRSKS